MATASRTPRIFISHSHKDNGFGIQLVEDLCQIIGDESSVWYDSRSGLKGGDIWWQKIKKELKQRNTFIVILSPNSLKSPWVKKEIALAWMEHVRKNKKIIPILYQPCKIPDDLQTIHIISFLPSRSYEESLKELELALKGTKNIPIIKDEDTSNSHQMDKMPQLVQEVEVAYHKDDWPCVIEKVNIIAKQYPEAMLPSLYRMQGWAYCFGGQPHLAQNALEKGIKLVKDPHEQLTLLDIYIAQFISEGQWDRSLFWINEALQLDPHNSILQTAKVDIQKRVHQERHISLKEMTLHLSNENNVAEVEFKNTKIESIEEIAQFMPNSDKQDIKAQNGFSKNVASDHKLKELELQRQKMMLQKEQFQLEKDLMNFAFEMSEKMASIYKDADSAIKAKFLQSFLTRFLSLEDEKES